MGKVICFSRMAVSMLDNLKQARLQDLAHIISMMNQLLVGIGLMESLRKRLTSARFRVMKRIIDLILLFIT
mgnify:CR=1 FL=1